MIDFLLRKRKGKVYVPLKSNYTTLVGMRMSNCFRESMATQMPGFKAMGVSGCKVAKRLLNGSEGFRSELSKR
jgi:hypothetical protein